ncbi:conserved hypothetical protein [Vibrio chagasii]|nr:conserved hypothetical protein [Vibrio chagasii]
MSTIIKGVVPRDVSSLPALEKTIKERYNVDSNTKKPLNINELSKFIGEKPSLLLCAMLVSESKCSKFGTECIIEILKGIAGKQTIYVSELDYGPNQIRPLNFKLGTSGFLSDEFEPINVALGEKNHATVSFKFTPEYKVSKQLLREDIRGSFDLDLKIEMALVIFADSPNQDTDPKRMSESISVGNIVVEFDGPSHLTDEKVRADKNRDSMIQSQGATVFRVQLPYQHKGPNSTALNRENLDTLLQGHIEDLKNHFQNRLYNTVKASLLLKSLIPEAAKSQIEKLNTNK